MNNKNKKQLKKSNDYLVLIKLADEALKVLDSTNIFKKK